MALTFTAHLRPDRASTLASEAILDLVRIVEWLRWRFERCKPKKRDGRRNTHALLSKGLLLGAQSAPKSDPKVTSSVAVRPSWFDVPHLANVKLYSLL